jgi:multiple sugar transport system ATP-binding protein
LSRIDIQRVGKIYGKTVVAVRDLNLSCEDGEFLAILGPSGSGKSTTLRMIAGLEDITEGEILFDGVVVNEKSPSERNIALAFESYALYPHMTVFDNIAFPLKAQGMRISEIKKRVLAIAEDLRVSDILAKKPSSLSGGGQQRVSLARALIREPNVTLLDEPISHMDQRLRAVMRAQIRRIHEELKLTTIYVTHDQAEAVSLCDRLVVMNHAALQQIGTVDDIWNHPANKFVATFVGEPKMNFIPAEIVDRSHVSVATKTGKKRIQFKGEVKEKYLGAEIALGIRPQEILLSDANGESSLAGSVELVEFQGENAVLTVKLENSEETEVSVAILGHKLGHVGDTVSLEIGKENIHLFDEETPILR